MHSRRQTGTLVMVIQAALSSPSTEGWGGPQEGEIFLTGRVSLDRERWAWSLEGQDGFHWPSRGEGSGIKGPGVMTHPAAGKRPLPCQGQQKRSISIFHAPVCHSTHFRQMLRPTISLQVHLGVWYGSRNSWKEKKQPRGAISHHLLLEAVSLGTKAAFPKAWT